MHSSGVQLNPYGGQNRGDGTFSTTVKQAAHLVSEAVMAALEHRFLRGHRLSIPLPVTQTVRAPTRWLPRVPTTFTVGWYIARSIL